MNCAIAPRRRDFWTALFGRSHGRPATRSRRRILTIEGLEHRLAPAISGSIVLLTPTTLGVVGNATNNLISVSGSDAALAITDAAGTLTNTVPGFTPGGPLPAFITAVTINGNAGIDAVAIGGLTTTRNLTVTAETIAAGATHTRGITLNANLINVAGDIRTDQAAPIAGSAAFNGHVSIAGATTIVTDSVIDGNITFAQPVTASGAITLTAGTGNVTAASTVSSAGTLTITANHATLTGAATAGGAVTIAGANNVRVANLTSGGAVTILANQDGAGTEGFTQTAGGIVTTGATVGVTVNTAAGGNGTATVRGITAAAGGAVTLTTASATLGGAVVDANGASSNVNFGAPRGGTLTVIAGRGGVSLDTSVTDLNATVNSGAALTGNIDIDNTAQALTVAGATTSNGSIDIRNDRDLTATTVAAGGAGRNVALTTTGAGSTLEAGAVAAPGDTVTLTSSSDIVDAAGDVAAAALVLSSVDGIAGPLTIDADTLSATTTVAGGIAVTDVDDLTVTSAMAAAGAVAIAATGNLTISGNVATSGSGAVTLAANQDLAIASGTVATGSGSITLTPARNLTVASVAAVSTGGPIAVTAPTTTALIVLDGSLSAGTSLTIAGAGGAGATTLNVSGTLAAGTDLAYTAAGTGGSVVNLSGHLIAGSNASLDVGGADSTLILTQAPTGTITSGGTTTIAGGSGTAVTAIDLDGSIVSVGDVTITGSTGPGLVTFDFDGSIISDAAVTITGSENGIAVINLTGTTTGASIDIHLGVNGLFGVLNIHGTLTATVGGGTITGTPGLDCVTVCTEVSSNTGTTLNLGAGNDTYKVRPSRFSRFTFADTSTNTDTNSIIIRRRPNPDTLIGANHTSTFPVNTLITFSPINPMSVNPPWQRWMRSTNAAMYNVSVDLTYC